MARLCVAVAVVVMLLAGCGSAKHARATHPHLTGTLMGTPVRPLSVASILRLFGPQTDGMPVHYPPAAIALARRFRATHPHATGCHRLYRSPRTHKWGIGTCVYHWAADAPAAHT